MAKCRAFVCDACGRHLPTPDDENALFIRVKRRWYSWHESGYIRERLCVCIDCQRKLAELIRTEE